MFIIVYDRSDHDVAFAFFESTQSILLSSFMLLLSIGINAGHGMQIWSLPLASSALMISLLFAVNMSYGFFAETKIKHHLTGLFGQYVPKNWWRR